MYKPKIKVRGKHGDKPDKSELYDKYCRTSHEVRGLKSENAPEEITDMISRTSHEVRGRNFGVLMDQFRDLHLKLHLTIAFLFTYNNKKGREW